MLEDAGLDHWHRDLCSVWFVVNCKLKLNCYQHRSINVSYTMPPRTSGPIALNGLTKIEEVVVHAAARLLTALEYREENPGGDFDHYLDRIPLELVGPVCFMIYLFKCQFYYYNSNLSARRSGTQKLNRQLAFASRPPLTRCLRSLVSCGEPQQMRVGIRRSMTFRLQKFARLVRLWRKNILANRLSFLRRIYRD